LDYLLVETVCAVSISLLLFLSRMAEGTGEELSEVLFHLKIFKITFVGWESQPYYLTPTSFHVFVD